MRQYSLEELLPHRAPMILISGYYPERVTDESLEAYVEISPASPFYDSVLKGVPGTFALEYMAQTVACLIGLHARLNHQLPRIGFVLGTRKLATLPPCFKDGTYTIQAVATYIDSAFAAFDCTLTDAHGEITVTATINCWQPDNLETL